MSRKKKSFQEALPDDENKENNDDFAVEDDLDLESFGDKKKKKKKKKPKDLDDLINDEDDKENEGRSAYLVQIHLTPWLDLANCL